MFMMTPKSHPEQARNRSGIKRSGTAPIVPDLFPPCSPENSDKPLNLNDYQKKPQTDERVLTYHGISDSIQWVRKDQASDLVPNRGDIMGAAFMFISAVIGVAVVCIVAIIGLAYWWSF